MLVFTGCSFFFLFLLLLVFPTGSVLLCRARHEPGNDWSRATVGAFEPDARILDFL
jgi:hypothetical protein